MKDTKPGRGRGTDKRNARPAHARGREGTALLIGWIFLGIVLVLAAAAVVMLLPGKTGPGSRPASAGATAPPAAPGPGSAFATDRTAPPLTLAEGTGGRQVIINRVLCDYTEPESITFGVLRGVDMSAIWPTLAANAAAAGWGTLEGSWSDNGDLTLRAVEHPVLNGDDFERQEAFLASAQPENLARTFMDNIGLIPLLQDYGITLTNYAENNDGMITFRGRGQDEQSECSVQFSFLFTGAFNQAVLRAVYLDGAVTTEDVLPLREAVKHAVTWGSAGSEATDAVAAELRYIRGLPFYVLTCSDGTVAYGLAVTDAALGQVPGAAEVYNEMMQEGIQEYVETPGAAF